MSRSNRRRSFVLAVGALLLVGSSAWGDEEKELDRTPQQCITTQQIARNEAISDRAIVFIMRGKSKTMYRNDLRAVCPTLQKGATQFDFVKGNHPASQLCGGTDGFTVRGRQQLPCVLGNFEPITQAEAEKLLGRSLADDTSKKSGSKAK